MANGTQLFLLADHVSFVLSEQESGRKQSLKKASPNGSVAQPLSSLGQGLRQLETSDNTSASPEDIRELRRQYEDLQARFALLSEISESQTTQIYPIDSASASSHDKLPRTASASRPIERTVVEAKNKSRSVKFQDSPATLDSSSTHFPYRDDFEDVPDQSFLSNQQIHTLHSMKIQEQDLQLDQLGQSIGRQRELSIQIGNELNEDGQLLDEIDEYTTRHETQLNRARKRLGEITRRAKNNLHLTTILVLIVLLILVIVVVK